MKAIIIEDEEFLAENLKEILEEEKYFSSLEICSDCDALKDHLAENKFDVYFIDKNFGILDGIKLAKEEMGLFQEEAHLIFMSGEDVSKEVQDLNNPHTHILPKPFNLGDLFELVEGLINKAA